IFSLISWAIILSKWSVLRRARVQSGRFLRAFRKAERLQDVAAVAEQFRPSPLVGVFEGAFQEYRRQGGLSNGLIRSPLAIQRAGGLAAAIPAVIAYNLIGGSIREFAARGDDFSLEMLNAVERQQAVYREPSEVRR